MKGYFEQTNLLNIFCSYPIFRLHNICHHKTIVVVLYFTLYRETHPYCFPSPNQTFFENLTVIMYRVGMLYSEILLYLKNNNCHNPWGMFVRLPRTVESNLTAEVVQRWLRKKEMLLFCEILISQIIPNKPFHTTPINRENVFQTALLAGALADTGVRKGDRVLIYMPLIPEAIISMLAIVRLGAIHSVVFGGSCDNIILIQCYSNPSPPYACSVAYDRLYIYFTLVSGFAARELCTRIDHAEPKVIIAASCGIEPNKIVE